MSVTKKKNREKRFRTAGGLGLKAAAVPATGFENNVIPGVSIISEGEALGHGLVIDGETVDQVVEFGQASKRGIKARFGHPNMSETALGTYIGRFKNFEKDGDRARADLFISDTSFDTPNGNLGEYVLKMAKDEPEAFGTSIVFDLIREAQLDEDGKQKRDEDDFPLHDLARVEKLHGADVVDEPATGDEFFEQFSSSVQPSAKMTAFLDEFMKVENWETKALSFLDKYVDNEEFKKEAIAKLSGLQSGAELLEEIQSLRKQLKDGGEKLPLTEAEDTMPMTAEQIAAEAKAKADAKELAKKELVDAVALAVADENERVTTIQTAGAKFGATQKVIDEMVEDKEMSMSAALKKFTALKEDDLVPPTGIPNIQLGAEDSEKFEAAVVDSVLMSAGHTHGIDPKRQQEVRASEFGNVHGPRRIIQNCLERDGDPMAFKYDADTLYRKAVSFAATPNMTSGQFVNILRNVANKSLAKGWETARTTYQDWVGTGSLIDFKTTDIVKTSEMSDINEIKEGDSPEFMRMTDAREQAQLATWGGKSILSRQAMVNDDLSAFSTNPAKMARSLRRKINTRIYKYNYDSNGANDAFDGPTMLEDSVDLYNEASHGNRPAVGAAPGQTTMDAAWNAFMAQTAPSPDRDRSDPVYLNVSPAYVISGARQRLALHKLFADIGYTVTGDENQGAGAIATNIHAPGQPRNLKIITDPLLDTLSDTSYPWWLAADAMDIDTIVYYTLNGNDAPYIASGAAPIGESRGLIYVIEHDFGFAAGDYRGLYVNTGAAK